MVHTFAICRIEESERESCRMFLRLVSLHLQVYTLYKSEGRVLNT